MAGFRNELVAFEAPSGWEDKSIVAFAAPPSRGKLSPNVVMSKDDLRPGETLRNHADRQMHELASRLDGFALLASAERSVDGLAAMEYRFGWTSEHADLHQHTVLIATKDKVVTFTGTSTRDDELVLHTAMEQLLGTVKFVG